MPELSISSPKHAMLMLRTVVTNSYLPPLVQVQTGPSLKNNKEELPNNRRSSLLMVTKHETGRGKKTISIPECPPHTPPENKSTELDGNK